MVVQHNMQAMNANRMLNVTTGQQAKSTEKLSSGYKINRAADDAAGLSISEKMRKQIRGLDQASTNAQDGISAVQTAEGALTEVHSMLQRMNELAVQAANGTNSESDRDAIQAEVDQLNKEIDRVAETTKFNEIYLLKGDVDGNQSTKRISAHDAGFLGKLTDNGDGTTTFVLDKSIATGDTISIGGKEYTIVDPSDVADYKELNADTLTGAAGDVLTDPDGNQYTYHVASDVKKDGTTFGAPGWYKEDETSAATETANVEQGWKYTTASTGKVQTLIGAKANTAGTVAILNNTTIASGVASKLVAGDTVKIPGEDGKPDVTYTIATSTNGNNITATDLAAKLKNGQTIEVKSVAGATGFATGVNLVANTAKKVYVVGADDGDATTITADEAYEKIKEELAKASSIGTDDANKAQVANKNNGTFVITQGSIQVKTPLSFALHAGSDAAMSNKIQVNIETMGTANLGIKGLKVTDNSGMAATYAIDAIADAIAEVSKQRSELGAIQNRLEHSIANLDNVVENTTSAESRIRDTDMAEAMVEYSKNNILAQAGQSMLAQANQSTQGVMSLLQ